MRPVAAVVEDVALFEETEEEKAMREATGADKVDEEYAKHIKASSNMTWFDRAYVKAGSRVASIHTRARSSARVKASPTEVYTRLFYGR